MRKRLLCESWDELWKTGAVAGSEEMDVRGGLRWPLGFALRMKEFFNGGVRIELRRRMGRGEKIRFGILTESCSDRVLMNVVVADAVVCYVADAMVGEASLPDGEFRGKAVGEASLDESDGSFESLLRSEKQVDVVGHDDEGVEFVVSFGAVVLEGFDEEFGVTFDLKEEAAVVGSAGDEEGAGAGCAGRDRHSAIVTARTSGAKAPF
jgi:hypothetical protein